MNSAEQDTRDLEPVRDGGRGEAAHHIMGEIAQLSALARRHELGMLSYLLDMAHLEAQEAVKRGDARRP